MFITGTDTEVGKTIAALAVMQAWQAQGDTVIGMKPVASGSRATPDGLRNEDAELLRRQSSVALPYAHLNPYPFAPPIAPHLAAAEVGVEISVPTLVAAYQVLRPQADRVVVEGAGGWRVPLNQRTTWADFVRAADLPVILVVGLRLGCINHAWLSAEAIVRDGLTLAGWIANAMDPDYPAQSTLDTLSPQIPAPLLGVLPRITDPVRQPLARYLSLPASS